MLYSLGNEKSDSGHNKCSCGPQVPHPWSKTTQTARDDLLRVKSIACQVDAERCHRFLRYIYFLKQSILCLISLADTIRKSLVITQVIPLCICVLVQVFYRM